MPVSVVFRIFTLKVQVTDVQLASIRWSLSSAAFRQGYGEKPYRARA